MINGKCVWKGGHGGLGLQVYEGGIVEAVNGEGKLIIACRPPAMDCDLCNLIDAIRGYPANHAERAMISDAAKLTYRNL